MSAGRPTEYNQEYVSKALEYLSTCEDTEGDNGLKVKIPTKGGLAYYLGVARDTLYDWSSKYPEFSDIMERLGAEQENRLINNGLSGDYNPTIAKVLLTKHGYVDKQETDVTSAGKPLIIPSELINKNDTPQLTENSSQ